jgi:hypothetical protein
MQSAMNVRVIVLVKVPHRVDHRARFLRSRSAIKINQGTPMRLLVKDRKILTDSAPINSAASNLMHPIICSTRRDAPVRNTHFQSVSDLLLCDLLFASFTRAPTVKRKESSAILHAVLSQAK